MRARVAAAVIATAFFLGAVSATPGGAQDFSDVEIRATDLGLGLAMLVGQGGNIGVSIGEDGAFLIDDQFAPLSPKIRAAVRELGGGDVRFLVNTHWHGDHTGGNEELGRAGALIFAHHNVRERMGSEQVMRMRGRTVPASPPGALPVVTFGEGLTWHLNGHEIVAVHIPKGHTDGDAIIHVRDANVMHLGDLYFNGSYPFVDLDSGGSIDGLIAGVDRALELANDETKIIPGHGPLSGRQELAAYRAMLGALRSAVKAEIDSGKTLEEAQAARPTAALDEEWGGGFMKPDQVVAIVYMSLKAAR